MKYRINLLPEREKNFVDHIVFFSFHYLRYILVLTQLVVICVFLYRFNVDQEIVDIKDNLLQKREIVKVSAPLINQGQHVYLKTTSIEDILHQQTGLSQMFEYLLSRFPAKLNLDSLEITGTDLVFDGRAADAQTIQSFYKRLQQDNRFRTISLVNISKDESGFVFKFALKNFISTRI